MLAAGRLETGAADAVQPRAAAGGGGGRRTQAVVAWRCGVAEGHCTAGRGLEAAAGGERDRLQPQKQVGCCYFEGSLERWWRLCRSCGGHLQNRGSVMGQRHMMAAAALTMCNLQKRDAVIEHAD